jgi:LacI family transcriptional regulator
MKALQEADIPFDTENVFYCETVSIDCSYQTMLGILKGRRNFSAIFAFNDIVAYGIIKAVYECRLRIPSDVAIIGYDDLPYSQICLVPLTTVHQESYQIGATAMEMLLQKIENPISD